MKETKESLIKKYKELKKNISNVNRDIFCGTLKVSKRRITNLFGSFSKFKETCENSINNTVSTSYTPVDTDDKTEDTNYVCNPYLDIAKNVKYNKSTSDYVFNFSNVKNIGNTIIIPKTQLYAMLQAYSDFDDNPKTIEEISLKFKMPIFVLKKVFQSLDMTHGSPPITSELLDEEQDDDKVADDLFAIRKSNIFNKFKEKTWQQTQVDANKWNLFENGILNPYEDILSTWTPPTLPSKLPSLDKPKTNDSSYIVTISDLHFGDVAHGAYSYYNNSEDWTTESTAKAIEAYILSIKNHLDTMKVAPSTCNLISLGDILHSISGYTDKGTELEFDTKGPLQFKVALDSLTKLISFLASEFKTLNITTVSGNHDSFADWVLFTALEKVFSNHEHVSFNVSMCRWKGLMIGSNLFVLEHGYSPFYKSKVPRASSAKESYIHRLILKETNEYAKKGITISNRYFMMGDLHHHSYTDFPMFEFIQLPTIVKSDAYADGINLTSRARQLTFICDNEKGIVQTISHYI